MGRAESEDNAPPADLEELLDRVEIAAREHASVGLGDVVDAIGNRAFGPLLLLPGLVMLAPVIGDIPGVPVLMGLLVIVIASQVLVRRRHIWIPAWIRRRSVSAGKVCKTVQWLRRPARWMDRWASPRYQWMLRHAGLTIIALSCILIAAATPLMEVVPFSANLAGLAITAFGVALLFRDGAIAALAMSCSLAALVLVGNQLLG